MSDAGKDLASWEKHTKGIGSKLLQKFGFSGRLGANETGIEKAIEVQVRPTNVGLGFGNAEGGTNGKPAKKRGSTDANVEKAPKKARKNNYPGKPKKSKHSIEQSFMEEESEKKYKIIDMTNPNAKAYNSDSDSDDQDSFGEDDDSFLPEEQEADRLEDKILLHDYASRSMKFMKAKDPKLSTRAVEINHKLSTNQNAIRIVNNKLSLLEERKRVNDKKLGNLKVITFILSEIKDLLHDNENIILKFQKQSNSFQPTHEFLELPSLLKNFQLIKEKIAVLLISHEEECSLFGLNGVFMQLFYQLLRSCFIPDSYGTLRLQFLRETTFNNLQLVLSAMNEFLDEKFFQYSMRRDIETNVLSVLAEKVLLKEMLDFMMKDFNPVEHTPIFIKYFLLFKPFIFQSSSLIQKFLDILKISLVPKLLSCVQNWTYSFGSSEFSISLQSQSNYTGGHGLGKKISGSDKSFLFHVWILPYLEVMDSVDREMITQLFPEIRRKIIQILKQWAPVTEDEQDLDEKASREIVFIVDLISPWREFFDVQSYSNIILKHLFPKLNMYLQRCFVIDPSNQNLKPFMNLMLFYSKRVIPFDYFQIFLIATFFSKFIPVLILWLQSFQVNKELRSLEEIGLWYKGWRALFPPEFFDSNTAGLSTLPNGSKVDYEIRNNFQIMTMFGLCLTIIEQHIDLYESAISSENSTSFHAKQSSTTLYHNRLLRNIQGITYQQMIELYHLKNQFATSTSNNSTAPAVQHKDQINTPSTLKEMIERFAKEKNIEFHLDDLSFGQRNTRVAGKHIYRFGTNLIYFENNLIFKYQKSSQEWIPASIRELDI